MKRMTVKQIMGAAAEWAVVLVVAAYLAINSLDFWVFATPVEKPLVAYLGFGLTGGGMVAYLMILMWRANTPLKKFVAIAMLAVCTIGELLTAGFGMKIEGWKKLGWTLTETDFSTMTNAVQILALLHAVAIIAILAGDKLAEAFGDEDRDGVPNYRDPDYKNKHGNQNHANSSQNKPLARQFAEETGKDPRIAEKTAEIDPNAQRGR